MLGIRRSTVRGTGGFAQRDLALWSDARNRKRASLSNGRLIESSLAVSRAALSRITAPCPPSRDKSTACGRRACCTSWMLNVPSTMIGWTV